MNTAASLTNCATAAGVSQTARQAGRFGRVQDLFIRALDAVFALQDRAGERRRLGALDERLLHDIGVDRASVAMEASKPFWRE